VIAERIDVKKFVEVEFVVTRFVVVAFVKIGLSVKI
jgi:hypothetical protein